MLCFQIDLEDTFDPNKLTFCPKPQMCDRKPRILPTVKEVICPETKLNIPVNVEKKKVKTGSMIRNLIFSHSEIFDGIHSFIRFSECWFTVIDKNICYYVSSSCIEIQYVWKQSFDLFR